ncbi:SufD family Fe-S cluster assembly protein [Candidatus Woesearchaeota archaeon]|nr:SufD family Fe-S cluster assembly protein [Candidatus Woesearchaeota archaeon]
MAKNKNSLEPAWLSQHRAQAALSMASAPDMPHKYGLSIVVKPATLDAFAHLQKEGSVSLKVDAPPGVSVITALEELPQRSMESFFGAEWSGGEHHKLHYLHWASPQNIVLVSIPKGLECTKPITINASAFAGSTFLTLCILAGPSSKAKILFHKTGGSDAYISEQMRIVVQKHATLEVVGMQNLDPTALHLQERIFRQEEGSSAATVDACFGCHYARYHISGTLEGKDATLKNTILFLAKGKQRFDLSTEATHIAPHTTSNMLTKGVLLDEAKALSRGLIRIEPHAAGSNGYEKQDALLLSRAAEADAIPNLEIHNHDVKCSHGSTIGRLDEAKLFYLMSRGLTRKQAQLNMIRGYFTPVLEQFAPEVKEKIHKELTLSLGGDLC